MGKVFVIKRLVSLAVFLPLLAVGLGCAGFKGRLPGSTQDGQAPEIEWVKGYGTEYDDFARSGHQTTDGGYIVTGTCSVGSGNSGICLVKTDGGGNPQWDATFGGSYDDAGESVWQTDDGGYIVAGMKRSSSDDPDVYLVKTDGEGNVEWENTYGGSGEDYGWCVQQTNDGGYIVAGHTDSYGGGFKVYLIKTDDEGNIEWANAYGTGAEARGWFVREDPTNGGYVVSGVAWIETPTHKMDDYYLVKTDDEGNVEWENTYGGSQGEHAWCVQPTDDGGYIVAGHSESYGDGWDFYLVKTDSEGNMEWDNTYGEPGNIYDEAWGVQQTSDGGYIVAGGTGTEPGDPTEQGEVTKWSVYVVRTDIEGNVEWDNKYGGTSHDAAEFIDKTDDGGYIVVVDSDSYGSMTPGNFCLMKLKPETQASMH